MHLGYHGGGKRARVTDVAAPTYPDAVEGDDTELVQQALDLHSINVEHCISILMKMVSMAFFMSRA